MADDRPLVRSLHPYPLSRHELSESRSSATLPVLPDRLQSEQNDHSSGTWTTSSGDPDLLEDTDSKDDRGIFVEEYNRLAQKVSLVVTRVWRKPDTCSSMASAHLYQRTTKILRWVHHF